MKNIYLTSKVKLNWVLDRIIDWCDMVLSDFYPIPWLLQKKHVRWIGNVCNLIRQWPREDAWHFYNENLSLIFVGSDKSSKEIRNLFFNNNNPQQEKIDRINLLKLPNIVKKWLENVDIVICELSYFHLNLREAKYYFSTPTWIDQEKLLPDSLESFLSGKKMKSIRHDLNIANKEHFDFQISQSNSDFEVFHERFYLPSIKIQHKDKALIESKETMMKKWFKRCSLVFIRKNGKEIAGKLYCLVEDTCKFISFGFLDGNKKLLEQPIRVIGDWLVINWAHQHGIKKIDWGGSHAWSSNGVFNYKKDGAVRLLREKELLLNGISFQIAYLPNIKNASMRSVS